MSSSNLSSIANVSLLSRSLPSFLRSRPGLHALVVSPFPLRSRASNSLPSRDAALWQTVLGRLANGRFRRHVGPQDLVWVAPDARSRRQTCVSPQKAVSSVCSEQDDYASGFS